MSDNKQTENTTVEAADDDEDYTLGQFREKTKDLPDNTPLIITAIVPTEEDDEPDDSEDDSADDAAAVESSDDSEDEDGDDEAYVTAPVLGVEIEDYTIAGENGAPDTIQKAVTIVIHVDDLTDEDDEDEGDEPVDNG
jgi:hypothetical protein